MAQFADYYIRYKYDFAPYEWENRQSHLAALFAEDSTIVFGEGDPSEEQQQEGIPYAKVFNHRVYHLEIANSTSKCKITKCFCKSTPLVLRNSISFLVSH